MKMKMGNHFFMELMEKLKEGKNNQGIESAIDFIGETFGCLRIVLFNYHMYRDSFEKKYEWYGETSGEKVLEVFEQENMIAHEVSNCYLRKVKNMGSLGSFFGNNFEKEKGVFYRYVIERDKKVVGVIIIECKQDMSEAVLVHISTALYMIAEAYNVGQYIEDLQMQNNYLHTLYSKMQTGLVQCVIEDNTPKIVWANEATYQIYGCEKEEYISIYGNSLERFVYVEDWSRVMERLSKLQIGDEMIEFEHRYINYFGQMRWLRMDALKLVNEDQKEVIQLVIADVTHSKQLENDLEYEKERYRIALNSSEDVIFEYDIMNDEYVSYGSFTDCSISKTEPIVTIGFKKKLLKGKICVKEDIPKYVELLGGENAGKVEICEKYMENGKEKKLWVSMEATPIYDNGILVNIIGKKTNISEKKQKEREELEVVQRDRLTKLYTRNVGEALIKQYLQEKSKDEVGSFLLIDLDNFQMINDTYGYMFGDAILEEVAEVIKAATRQNDIAVRYGGDEFLILMKNTEKGRTDVYGKRIYEKICNLYAGEYEDIKISCSVGMVSTEMANDYQTLFQYADSMLAYVKFHGKSDAVCYSPYSKPVLETQGEQYMENNADTEIDEMFPEKDNEDIVSFAFAILEQTKDMRSAINLLLAKIGRQLKLNKISVLEADHNFLCNIITYEWIARKEFHDSICKYNITQQELELWKNRFDSEGLFVMKDEWRKEFTDGIKLEGNAPRERNQLYSAIYEEGNFKGAMVFEHSDPLYVWPKEVRTKLKEVSKIISTHITKANADIASKAKTEFLSRMSHEIRTPMNAIVGMTSIAQSVIGDDEKVGECLGKISTSTQYLLSLINDILDMSRIESGSMTVCKEAFHLDKLVKELVVLMSPQAEHKSISLQVKKSYSDEFLIGDELRLNQVLINIIGNALKFTPENGTITLSVEQVVQEEGLATIRFSVSDTGIGISEENLSRIFNAFEQAEANTARRFGGTGLGLAISSNLVQLMGGNLDVKSEEGKGSEFFFTIEFKTAKDEDTKFNRVEEKEDEEEVYFENKRLLVVEDNEINAEITQTVLEMVGIYSELACNGQEAVDKFVNSEVGYYDAILMDIRMPVMDGLEATKCIRTSGKENSRTIPIIAMTANAFDEDMKKSIDSGMNGHLSKPIDVNKLYQVLKEIMPS